MARNSMARNSPCEVEMEVDKKTLPLDVIHDISEAVQNLYLGDEEMDIDMMDQVPHNIIVGDEEMDIDMKDQNLCLGDEEMDIDTMEQMHSGHGLDLNDEMDCD